MSLIYIIGPSGVGKDSLCNFMIENNNYKRLPLYTTRDKRIGEVDGVEYTFCTYDKFMELFNSGIINEYRKYNFIEKNGNKTIKYYGTSIPNNINNESVCYIGTGTYESFKNIYYSKKVQRLILIKLISSEETQIKRYFKRETWDENTEKELMRRLAHQKIYDYGYFNDDKEGLPDSNYIKITNDEDDINTFLRTTNDTINHILSSSVIVKYK